MMWKKYKLSEIGTVVGGATPSTTVERFYGGDIPWLTPKDLSNFQDRYIEKGERNITQEGLDSCSAQLLPANTVLFSSRAPIGYVAIAKKTIATNQGFKSIIPNEKVDSLFLYYILRYNKEKIEAMGSGTTFKEVSGAVMKNIEVALPSLEEQRRIAGILGAIDDKIENNRRINANLELQAQALYKQWFVDFEFPNEDSKPYKSSGGKMVDSELDPIPDGWSVIGYCDAVDIKGGGTPPTNNPEFWNGSIPFFTPKDVPSDCFAIHTEKSITEAGLSNCNSKLYAKDTVFITARGTVGKVVMAGCSMAMNQTNYALIGKNELSQYFVYLLTIALVDRLLKKANGAVFNAITTRDFEGEQIVHPTNFVLGKFIDIISPLYQQVLSIAKENETLTTLRDTLLPKLMNGEIITK